MIKQSMYEHTCMFMNKDAGHDKTDVNRSVQIDMYMKYDQLKYVL